MSKETPMIDFTQPFNFAAHLFALNEGRPGKIAYRGLPLRYVH